MNFFKASGTYSFGLMLAVVGILISLVPAGAPTRRRSLVIGQADHAPTSAETPTQSASSGERRAEVFGKLPLSFESNQGQTDKTVNFVARGTGYSLSLWLRRKPHSSWPIRVVRRLRAEPISSPR